MEELNFFNKTKFKFNFKKDFLNVFKSFKSFFNLDKLILVDITFVDTYEIQTLNKTYRNKDYVTDILSFDFGHEDIYNDMPFVAIGELVICPEKIIAQAQEFNHSLKREYCYLFAHGLVHLMGYDHELEEERIQMNNMVDQIIAPLNITREDEYGN
ncbi:rRNA maturation RNase YbeY [Mycoplasmopsis hyopharyngis]|uniref:rRNA maturation RNase YbeY n=1 Tax=Mycoplasmopsis hyopharyngis TaxID=29558 RepID=UPI003873504D